MSAEYNQAIDAYQAKWDRLASAQGSPFFAELRPTAIGWKVADPDEFNKRYAALLNDCEQVYIERLNDRLIAKMHLGEQTISSWGISIVKIMQRRPNSTDATGLDHVDFYCANMTAAETTLGQTKLHWTHESNGPNHSWISIWFEGTEAKLLGHTVLEVAARNLQDINDGIVQG